MTRQIVSIVMMLACLVAVIVLKSRCGPATENLFRALETVPDGGAPARDGAG